MTLWTFSVSLYHQPGVEEECLSLQNRFSINVNVLLLCLYAGAEFGAIVSRDDVDAANRAIFEWHTQVVAPIHQIHRLIKRHGGRDQWPQALHVESLRAQIKSAELESERLELAMLQEWFNGRLPYCSRSDRNAAVAANCLAHSSLAEGMTCPWRLVDLVTHHHKLWGADD